MESRKLLGVQRFDAMPNAAAVLGNGCDDFLRGIDGDSVIVVVIQNVDRGLDTGMTGWFASVSGFCDEFQAFSIAASPVRHCRCSRRG